MSELDTLIAELREQFSFGDNASLDIQTAYANDRYRYLAKNGVGLFVCGADAENKRLSPILAALLDALELARSQRDLWVLEGEYESDAIDIQRHLDAQLAAALTGRP